MGSGSTLPDGTSCTEASANAAHDIAEVRLGDAVEDGAAFSLGADEPAVAHDPEMPADGRLRDGQRFGNLGDGATSFVEQELDDAQALWMGDGAQAGGGLVGALRRKRSG